MKSLMQTPLNFAASSKTGLIFDVSFSDLMIGKCAQYHRFVLVGFGSTTLSM
jgi:hypothetical protein